MHPRQLSPKRKSLAFLTYRNDKLPTDTLKMADLTRKIDKALADTDTYKKAVHTCETDKAPADTLKVVLTIAINTALADT